MISGGLTARQITVAASKQPSRINQVYGVIPHVGVTIQRLRIQEVVTIIRRIRLIKPGVPAVVTAEHGFVAVVAVPVVRGELAWLEGGVAGPGRAGVTAPRIELDGAADHSRTVRDPLVLRDRIFMYPGRRIVILHRQQT